MKKILFASTALVATAGVAAAELTIGGSARFGLAYNEAETNETRIEQRMRVNITGIAETDAGVKLEARFRLEANEDDHENSISGRGPGAAGFAVSFGGLRVDVGNVSNVLDSGDQVDYFGYGIGFSYFLETDSNFNGPATGFGAGSADATTIKVRYTVGDFSHRSPTKRPASRLAPRTLSGTRQPVALPPSYTATMQLQRTKSGSWVWVTPWQTAWRSAQFTLTPTPQATTGFWV